MQTIGTQRGPLSRVLGGYGAAQTKAAPATQAPGSAIKKKGSRAPFFVRALAGVHPVLRKSSRKTSEKHSGEIEAGGATMGSGESPGFLPKSSSLGRRKTSAMGCGLIRPFFPLCPSPLQSRLPSLVTSGRDTSQPWPPNTLVNCRETGAWAFPLFLV